MFNLQVQLKILAASKTQNLINDPVRSNVKTGRCDCFTSFT